MTSRSSSRRPASRPAAFTVHPTPIGQALVVATDEGLAALQLLEVHVDARNHALAALTEHLGAPLAPGDDATRPITDQLDAYFAGELRGFDVPLDLRAVHGFVRTALEAVCEIPYGAVGSYADVAVAAGSPGANRAVGTACARTPISIVVPVHRVVRSDGSIGEYGGHPERKRFLLDLEERVVRASPGHRISAGV